MNITRTLPLRLLYSFWASCVVSAGTLSAQIEVRSSEEGRLSVVFTSLKEFNVVTTGTTSEVLIVIENAYLTPQGAQREDGLSASSRPFLDIEEFNISDWGLEVGAGTADPGTANEIDPRDLIVRFLLSEEITITDDLTVAFGIGGVLSNSAFPIPDNLGPRNRVFFAGSNSSFRSNRLATETSFDATTSAEGSSCVLALEEANDNMVSLAMASSFGDRLLEFSSDLMEWQSSGLFVPEGGRFSFPLSTNGESKRFYRLSEPLAQLPLSAQTISVSGLTLADEFAPPFVYRFHPDGSGTTYEIFSGGQFDFTWSEVSSIGLTTVALTQADGYTESINLQAPLFAGDAIDFYFSYHTVNFGPESFHTSFASSMEPYETALPARAESALQTLNGTTWVLDPDDGNSPHLTIDFTSRTTATGPAIADGSETTWDYRYVVTGGNTASLDVTDGNNDFIRIFLFFPEDEEGIARFSSSSSVHQAPFGSESFFVGERQ